MNKMIKITSGPYKGTAGYLSFDEKAAGILNCKVNGTWLEFPENKYEFEPLIIGSES